MAVQLYLQAFADFTCHSYQHNILEMFLYLVYIYAAGKLTILMVASEFEITSYRVTNFFLIGILCYGVHNPIIIKAVRASALVVVF